MYVLFSNFFLNYVFKNRSTILDGKELQTAVPFHAASQTDHRSKTSTICHIYTFCYK
jgi:hypothetical protein